MREIMPTVSRPPNKMGEATFSKIERRILPPFAGYSSIVSWRALSTPDCSFSIRSRAVVVACGAIHTPALLKRSGLQNPNVGKHLRLHPASAVFGIFDEELRPWEGVMQALYSDQHRDLDGGYGLKYETAANHPHLFVPFAPWRGSEDHFTLMQGLPGTVPIGVLSEETGGFGSPLAGPASTAHIMGTARMGTDPATSVVDPFGRMHELDNVYVADGSVFVSSGGFTSEAAIEIRRAPRHVEKIDLDDFIKMWTDHYDKMKEEDRRLMPLKKIAFLAPDERP